MPKKKIVEGKPTVEQRLNQLEYEQELFRKTQLRVAAELEAEKAEKTLLLENYAKFRATLKYLSDVFEKASDMYLTAASYTQEEIMKMTADEYRNKILIPLGMGR